MFGFLINIILGGFLIFLYSVSGETCDRNNNIFLKSTQSMVVENNAKPKWGKNVTVGSEMLCPGYCQKMAECKSAIYDDATPICLLRDVDRFSMNAKIILSPNMNYYEKQECPNIQSRFKFVSVVRDAVDCMDIFEKGWKINGVYTVVTSDKDVYQPILCEMSLLGGGWTVVQQRMDGSVDFNRNWLEYKRGFGTLKGEFWYGNDRLHHLTNHTSNEILFVLENKNGIFYYPLYEDIKVASEKDLYRLTVGRYRYIGKGPEINGNGAGNFPDANSMAFSTPDQDNDNSDRKCGEIFKSGWWFNSCCKINLNNRFAMEDKVHGIKWDGITYQGGSHHTLRSTTIMIRKKRQ